MIPPYPCGRRFFFFFHRVDADFFRKRIKICVFKKYPDTRGRGLIEDFLEIVFNRALAPTKTFLRTTVCLQTAQVALLRPSLNFWLPSIRGLINFVIIKEAAMIGMALEASRKIGVSGGTLPGKFWWLGASFRLAKRML